jgi:trehalose 6-phosphate synthase/phosphatase
LFHYILWDSATDGKVETANWGHYKTVNERFADTICDLYQQGDLIWVQDYHLMLLPSILRNRISKANIGLFLHTPFPSSEIFKCLPSIEY